MYKHNGCSSTHYELEHNLLVCRECDSPVADLRTPEERQALSAFREWEDGDTIKTTLAGAHV